MKAFIFNFFKKKLIFKHNLILRKRGFTLVEMLVAVTVFIITVLALLQIHFHVIRAERISYLLLHREKNIHYALETMARAMRMGGNFSIPTANQINFTTFLGGEPRSMMYQFNQGTIEQSIDNDSWMPIIDPEKVQITSLRFFINRPSVNIQPRITIAMQGFSEIYGIKHYVRIQTSVTPRILHFEP